MSTRGNRGRYSDRGRDGQRPSTSENTTPQTRVARIPGVNAPYTNPRANETLQEQVARLQAARIDFLQASALSGFNLLKWQEDYVEAEQAIRCFGGISYQYLNESGKREISKIVLEVNTIVNGRQTVQIDEVHRFAGEIFSFEQSVTELGFQLPDRTSKAWEDFRSAKAEQMIADWKLDHYEGRMLILYDIFQIYLNNKIPITSANKKEYQVVLKLVLTAWEEWKREHNIRE
jgi:hypothetical protein